MPSGRSCWRHYHPDQCSVTAVVVVPVNTAYQVSASLWPALLLSLAQTSVQQPHLAASKVHMQRPLFIQPDRCIIHWQVVWLHTKLTTNSCTATWEQLLASPKPEEYLPTFWYYQWEGSTRHEKIQVPLSYSTMSSTSCDARRTDSSRLSSTAVALFVRPEAWSSSLSWHPSSFWAFCEECFGRRPAWILVKKKKETSTPVEDVGRNGLLLQWRTVDKRHRRWAAQRESLPVQQGHFA